MNHEEVRELRIESIAHHLCLVPIIAGWQYGEWGHLTPHRPIDQWEEVISKETCLDKIPTIFLALDGATPIGSVALVEYNMESRRDLTPWLAGTFVLPEYRTRGVANTLVRHAMKEAKRFGSEMLYLYTRDVQVLYEKLGWRALERATADGREVTIMRAQLRI